VASLLALSLASAELARRRLAMRVWLHIGTLALTILAFWFGEPFVQLPAAVAVITEAVAWWLRVSAEVLHGKGREAMRSALLCDAMSSGETIDSADLRASFNKEVYREAERIQVDDYYASSAPPGKERLRDLLAESAFFSKHLFAAASQHAFVLGLLPLVCVIVAIVLAAPFANAPATLLLTRLLVGLLAVLISADSFGHALAWHRSSQLANRVDHALSPNEAISMEALIASFADYGVATSNCPPVPSMIYLSMRDRLNRIWQEQRHAS
jgi:hypothetical protein